MKDEYEIVIIGGGPGGLSAAIELAKNNKDVLLLEKNKEIGPKVCAGGLTTKIESLGVSLDLADRQFTSIKAHVEDKEYSIHSPQPFLAMMDRTKLGHFLLHKAVASGAEVRTNTVVTEMTPKTVITNNGTIRYKYLIGADGSLSEVRKYLGIPTQKVSLAFQYIVPRPLENLEVFFDKRYFGSSYVWIFPHARHTSIGLGLGINEIKGKNLRNILNAWCQTQNINLGGAVEQSWTINNDYRGWQFNDIFLVGDAGGFTPALTGEGIYYAIISGQEVARKIINEKYQCLAIKNILTKKSRQEKLLRIMQMSPTLSEFCYSFLLSLTKSNWLSHKAVKFFS